MISNYLDRKALLREFRDKRSLLDKTLKYHAAGGKDGDEARALLKNYAIEPADLPGMIRLLEQAVERIAADSHDPANAAYIPSSPLVCTLQTGMTERALSAAGRRVERNRQPVPATQATRGGKRTVQPKRDPLSKDTSAPWRLKEKKAGKAGVSKVSWGNFIENDDVLYALKGAKAKADALMRAPRLINTNPARSATTEKPLSLYLFGDWGTGLPLAQQVTREIARQLKNEDGTQCHVIHLGDVYYVGDAKEYKEYMLADECWPVLDNKEVETIGSWSLNGNHDRYTGGYGYFDTLLRDPRFIRWHRDEHGEPSSFFVIENGEWQIFGLDTSWQLPTLGEAITEESWTIKDFAGQNGILTHEQGAWMARVKHPDKGCVLLTHHQPASSRSTEKQHANEAITALKAAGVYDKIDAWIWGHEHRAVVFRPRAERKNAVLKQAPPLCCCLGHGGVPVTKKNFELEATIGDVLWQEDRLGNSAPIYEKKRVVPFGFGKLETSGKTFRLTFYDHTGDRRYQLRYVLGEGWTELFRAPSESAGGSKSSRSSRKPATTKKKKVAARIIRPPKKKAAGPAARNATKKATKKVIKKPASKVGKETTVRTRNAAAVKKKIRAAKRR